ncbi:hypothetical protein [Mycobacterium asiaticum]|nr:hypothetical protein [Mycobacterium asiaticum]
MSSRSFQSERFGELLLQPMIDAVWQRVAGPEDSARPTLTVRVEG